MMVAPPLPLVYKRYLYLEPAVLAADQGAVESLLTWNDKAVIPGNPGNFSSWSLYL
jgi:hypothetical protein